MERRRRGRTPLRAPWLPASADVPEPDLTARLERWVAAARVEDAVGRRRRARWLRQQAEEEGRLRGVLAGLAERGDDVAVRTLAGRVRRGNVQTVGRDFVALALDPAVSLVALRAVAAVTVPAGRSSIAGDHPLARSASLAEVLAELCAERERAVLLGDDGAPVAAGVLRAVGRDLVTVALDGGRPPSTAYVPMAALAEVVLS